MPAAKSFLILSTALALALGLTACQPRSSSADQTQSDINAANESLQQMDILESGLRDSGFLIRNPQLSAFRISNANETELIGAKLKLEEFVTHGQSALRVANRADVAFGERISLEKRIVAAQMLLEKVRIRMGVQAGELGARFWSTWYECNRSDRKKLSTRVQRYLQCDEVLIRGRHAIYGGDDLKAAENRPVSKLSDSESQNLKALLETLNEE